MTRLRAIRRKIFSLLHRPGYQPVDEPEDEQVSVFVQLAEGFGVLQGRFLAGHCLLYTLTQSYPESDTAWSAKCIYRMSQANKAKQAVLHLSTGRYPAHRSWWFENLSAVRSHKALRYR
jgi:hypothetical protein